MLPHSAVGGFAPRPRNESPASSIIIVPTSNMAVTRIGPAIFGRMCLTASCVVEHPASFAAFRNGVSRIESVWLLAIRAYFGHEIAARARTALWRPPPRTPATASAKTRPGNARQRSETRMSRLPARPRAQPQKTPTAVPKAVIIATKRNVEKMLVRLPAMTRENISRP